MTYPDLRAAAERVSEFTRIAAQGTPGQAPAYWDAAYMAVYNGTPFSRLTDWRALALHCIEPAPLDVVLPCPRCGLIHVDAPEPDKGWANPPHKSHLCHGCGLVWRPADVPTYGVAATKTRGEKDSPADEAEPVTAAWMEATIPGFGLTSNAHVGGCQHADWRLMAHKSGEDWAFIARTARGEASLLCRNRGDARRLFAALGIGGAA